MGVQLVVDLVEDVDILIPILIQSNYANFITHPMDVDMVRSVIIDIKVCYNNNNSSP